MADDAAGSVIVKKNCVRLLQNNHKLSSLFPVKLIVKDAQDGAPEGYVFLNVYPDCTDLEQPMQNDFLTKLQVNVNKSFSPERLNDIFRL